MRSFIKAHRRGESANSDFFELEPEPKAVLTHKTTPVPSPVIPNGPFTPPSTVNVLGSSGAGQASLSSPKKLLTPIKKMFSLTHSKSTITTPNSNDSLQNVVDPRSKRKIRTHRHTRSQGSVSNISDLIHPDSNMALDSKSLATAAAAAATSKYSKQLGPSPKFHTSASSPSLVNSYRHSGVPVSHSHTSLSSFQSSGSHPSTTQTKLNPPINLLEHTKSQVIQDSIEESNESSNPIEDQPKLDTKLVSFDQYIQSPPPSHTKKFSIHDSDNNLDGDYGNELEEEYEGDDSDSSSSQFSFVKDSNCGRNTSVKYYKVVKSSKASENDFQQLNTFNENDLGIDVDEFSDYDFENNGMDDDYDGDYGDENENDVQYNKLFDDEDEPIDVLPQRNHSFLENEHHGNLHGERNSTSISDQNYNSLEIDEDELQIHEDTDDDVPYNSAILDDPAERTIDGGFKDSEASRPIEDSFANNTLTQKQPLGLISLGQLEQKHSIFNKSYHLSIQGVELFDDYDGVDTDAYGDDILENYLDVSKSPSLEITGSYSGASESTPDPSSNDNFYEVSSPIINGLTIGNNLRHRLPRLNSNDFEKESYNISNMYINRSVLDIENEPQNGFFDLPKHLPPLHGNMLGMRSLRSFHGSISDDLNTTILEKTEEFTKFTESRKSSAIKAHIGLGISEEVKVEPEPEPKKKNDTPNPRLSVIELMSLLGGLEKPKENDNEEKSEESVRNSALSSLEKSDSVSQDDTKNRLSIIGMMSILSDLEKTQASILEENNRAIEKAQQNRKSILDMMSTLSSLETSANTEEEAKNKRNSINNMMQILATLDLTGPNSSSNSEQSSLRAQKAPRKGIILKLKEDGKRDKRYSWFNNDESVNFSSLKPPTEVKLVNPKETNYSESETETLDAEAYNRTLDPDLLDEINQLPEDYDFEEDNRQRNTESIQVPAFLRSNSYNNKPVKALIDNNYQCNKIETSNKTVTFYRSNSSGSTNETARVKSVSRAPSTRSINSFTSVNEEVEEEDDDFSHGADKGETSYFFMAHRKKTPLAYKLSHSTTSQKPTILFR
ncbi:uncharacterized protein CANTADRAFT_295440 [Suhomyces tanzawaensis NRRL Y-17324]|uniref:Uncharacterized protein n=1 Tax=Suhomyces tanzawaensis NRRL Y-17324 TaxID=984487 RepID=A0A1E4SF32_9ASCO|nr:uncharacterized protein CANTADRAFT_295440 [Suhomyces tanzawaensis NRRL Y-17324]ODV78100.1 hypothetical protein CANTADRAFT_295440 [Suhomyces tanzawaensis NRRL Y-17324]